MLRRAVVTAFLIWTVASALAPVVRGFGRSGRDVRPACCRNESTCPMHTKVPNGRSLRACTCREELTMLVASEHGVLRDARFVAAIDPTPQQFAVATERATSFAPPPSVPPPRVG